MLEFYGNVINRIQKLHNNYNNKNKNKMTKFGSQITRALDFYVYALIDPFNNKIFYVGKGSRNNRAFDHLKASKTESAKTKKIKEIRAKGEQPVVEILRYGLKSHESALEVEAAIIDALGIENLTNIIRGHKIERGRLGIEEIKRLYDTAPVKISSIKGRLVMFFINRTYSTLLTEIEIYDATRGFWKGIAKSKRMKGEDGKLNYLIALSIYDSVVVRVYSIIDWYVAGTTLSTRIANSKDGRYEFIGNLINDHPLLGKKLIDDNGNNIKAVQKGYRYIN